MALSDLLSRPQDVAVSLTNARRGPSFMSEFMDRQLASQSSHVTEQTWMEHERRSNLRYGELKVWRQLLRKEHHDTGSKRS